MRSVRRWSLVGEAKVPDLAGPDSPKLFPRKESSVRAMKPGRGRRGARPTVFRTLKGEGTRVRLGPTGEVGTIFRGGGLEVVWVRKDGEMIDPNWFMSRKVDILMVIQGRLRVEFSERHLPTAVLGVGDVLVLPPGTKCRAYRWPRSSRRATVFLAVYPVGKNPSNSA